MRYPHAAVGPLRRGFVFRAFAEPAFEAARLSLNVFNSAAEIDAFVVAAALAFVPLLPPATAQESAAIPAEVEAGAIRNYVRIDDRLAVAGQPAMEILRGLGRMGFKTVLTLRTPGEIEEDEGAIVREAGLDYVSVPISSGSFNSADVDAVAGVLDDETTAPVLLHCASSNRVGGVLAVLEARRGKSTEDALAYGKQAGLKSASMIEAATRLIEAER